MASFSAKANSLFAFLARLSPICLLFALNEAIYHLHQQARTATLLGKSMVLLGSASYLWLRANSALMSLFTS